jgi:putative selenium metabolism hydrolase
MKDPGTMLDTKLLKDIQQIGESLEDELVNFVQELIRIPSPSGQEAQVIDRIRMEMDKCGFEKIWIDDMGNCCGRIGSGERTLAIDGHCDTVDVGNIQNWNRDPFEPHLEDGIIYGRGAADQKGGLAAAVYSIRVLQKIGIPDNVSIVVVASVLEEDYEGLCWQVILSEGSVKPEVVLLTEPSNLGIRVGQRGRIEFKVRTTGKSCHGSAPERGVNAIYRMAPLLEDIERLNSRLPIDPILGKGTITVTEFSSTAPSLCAVADSATIHIDRRLTAGESEESAKGEIERLSPFERAEARLQIPEYQVQSYTGRIYPMKAVYPAWLMEEEDPCVRLAVRIHHQTIGGSPDVGPWTFSTNGVATRGLYQIPTLGLGPGEEIHAHAPSDQVSLSHLSKSLQFYSAFSLAWAGDGLKTGPRRS